MTPPEEVVDLDGDPDGDLDGSGGGPAPREGGTRLLPRWARSRWAVPVAAAAVVLLGGAAGFHQVRAAAVADLARAQQLASLQLNVPSVFSTDRTPQHDARGRLLQQVQVQVYNAGSGSVRVTPVGTSFAAAELVAGAEPLALAPGTGSLLSFVLAVDCSAVPPPSGLDAAPTGVSSVQLAVETGGRRSEQRYLLPGRVWGTDLGEQLAFACAPDDE